MELGVTVYQASVGAVAFVHPDTLRHSSYAALLAMMPASAWGLSLWTVAVLHTLALRLNGRSPIATAIIRTVACGCHLFVMALIGACYVTVGDYYRLVTTVFLILAILGAVSMATEDIARLWVQRREMRGERKASRRIKAMLDRLGDGNGSP